MTEKRLYQVLAVALSVLYLWVGTRPRLHPALGLFPDWLGHALAYGVLAWVLRRGVGGWATAFAGALSQGFFLEWLQRSIPGRAAEVSDLVADAFGSLMGAWLFHRRC